MPKPLFRGVCALSITPFPPVGSPEDLTEPRTLWQKLAEMLDNLGYEVHSERMG